MPTSVVNVASEYHLATAPVPKLPPEYVNVIFANAKGQKLLLSTVALVGATDAVFTVIIVLAQVVTLQSPSART